MRRKVTGLIIGLAAFALCAVNVQAGEINANEQRIISAASQSFSYNGATYVVKSSYIAQGQAKLAKDDVDLSASQADSYIAQFHGSYQELVEEGYCDLVSGTPNTSDGDTTPEPQHSKKEAESNKLLLKTILGKPGSVKSDNKDQKSEEQKMSGTDSSDSAAATPVPQTQNTWDKEEDLGSSVSFENVDREQAKDGKLTISGNGSQVTIEKKEVSEKQSGDQKVAAKKDNFLSRLVHISLWKILFWIVFALTVVAAIAVICYVIRIKQHHHKKRGLRRGIAIGAGICAGGWTLLLMLALGLYFGVYNNNSIQRQLMESDYFLGVTGMIRETAQDQLEKAGYDGKIASEVFTLSSVYIEEKQYIDKVLSGQKDAEISTEGIDSALRTEITGKDQEKNDNMILSLKHTYCDMLQFELGNVIYESRSTFMGWFYLTCVVSVVMLLLLFILLCRLYGYPHKAARVMFVAILVSSCLVTGGAVLAKVLKVTDKIKATPVYYLQFLQKYAAWSLNVLMYVGCLGILAAIALLIWKRYLHTIYAE